MVMAEPTYDADALRRGITAMETDVDNHQAAIRELRKRIDEYHFHLREALKKVPVDGNTH